MTRPFKVFDFAAERKSSNGPERTFQRGFYWNGCKKNISKRGSHRANLINYRWWIACKVTGVTQDIPENLCGRGRPGFANEYHYQSLTGTSTASGQIQAQAFLLLKYGTNPRALEKFPRLPWSPPQRPGNEAQPDVCHASSWSRSKMSILRANLQWGAKPATLPMYIFLFHHCSLILIHCLY